MRPPPDPRPWYKSLAPLRVWQELARPADWSAVFGRVAPLTLEIGTGNGEFITRAAQEQPECDFVGIDLRWASVKRALRNLEKARVRNVRILLDDARPVIERLFAPRSLQRIFILFPCPWRKEKHEHHRLLHRSFLEMLNERLVEGGELLLVTDWTPYLDWTLAQLPGSGLRAETRSIEPRFQTKYERKWSRLGQQRFHEVRMIKEEHREPPALEEPRLNPPHLATVDLDRFLPRDESGPITVTFKEIVRDRERNVLMVRTVVAEEAFTQQFWITIARAADGSWWVVPARGCQTVPTAGVQRALELVAEHARGSVAAAAAP